MQDALVRGLALGNVVVMSRVICVGADSGGHFAGRTPRSWEKLLSQKGDQCGMSQHLVQSVVRIFFDNNFLL